MGAFAAPPSGLATPTRRRLPASESQPQRPMGSWLHQLATLWQTGRAQATAAAALGGPSAGTAHASGVEVLDGLQDAAAAQGQAPKEHLIVMVHGLFGTRDNWRAISELLGQHLDPSTSVLFVSHCNERQKTFEGVDVCGERLAEEVRGVVARHPGLKRISILGHSMGGLISRYAAGRLFDPASSTIAGLDPCHFVALATPHLGCDAQENPAQVPLINWLAAVPAVGSAVQTVVSELAAPFSELALGRVGRQFFLTDTGKADEQPPGLLQLTLNQQQQAAGSSGGGASCCREPLLSRMTRDQPEEGLLFMSALAAFETRTLYANSSGDHLVGWANSSLRRLSELPPKNGRGTGVVREDPLESAWATHKRPQLHATPAAAALHSSEGHRVSERAILEARSVRQLVASSSEIDSSGGLLDGPAAGGQAIQPAASVAGGRIGAMQQWEQQRQQVESPGLAGASALELARQSAATQQSSSNSPASINGVSAAAGRELSSYRSAREEQVEEMLSRLQALGWRRIDVCFGATLLPLLSHQHIQMQRWWVNWPGRAVVKHLALQIQAMEQLRLQSQQQQRDNQQQRKQQQNLQEEEQ